MGLELIYEDGQTPIAEEEKRGLKLSLSTQGELDEAEQLNIEKALVWLLGQEFTANEVLSEAFMKQLHKKMFADIWKWAGKFRQTEKNIGVPWIQIARELKILCDDALFWIEHETFQKKEIALRFKHRLVSIHCFPNGNGRHSRIMADVLMEQVFGLSAFSWSAGNLVSATEERKMYIAALRAATQGDMGPLLAFA